MKEFRPLILLCALFLGLGTLRLNDLSLYSDSARYVIWGTSFGHLSGLVDDTQPDSDRYVVNAPLYALPLSPILTIFPLSLSAGKVYTLLWGIGFIVAYYLFLMRLFGKPAAIAGALLIVLNPLQVVISSEVLSEAAFLALTFLTFILIEKLESGERWNRRDVLLLLIVLSVIVLLREIAIALVLAVVVHFVRRKEYRLVIAILVCVALCTGAWALRNQVLIDVPAGSQKSNISFVFDHFVTPPSASLIQEFLLRFASSLNAYWQHLAGMLFFPIPDVLIVGPSQLFRACYSMLGTATYIVPPLFFLLLVLGVWSELHRRKTGLVHFVFLIAHVVIVLLYPVLDIRFLLPILPFMIFYAIAGFRWAFDNWIPGMPGVRQATALSLSVLVLVPNALTLYEIISTHTKYISSPSPF